MITSSVEFAEELPKDVTVNPTWHFIATTWSKLTDVLIVYVSGKTRSWGKKRFLTSGLSGGGSLSLTFSNGPLDILLTSFNMWNHVLSADVIAEQAKSCNGAVGNVKEWYDIWSVFQSKNNYYTKPSTCAAPILPVPKRGSSADDVQSSGKSLFAKYKKKKSSIKYGNKHISN